MQRLLRDVFRDLVVMTRENSLWEKATPEQIENVVSAYLLRHYSNTERLNTLTTAKQAPARTARTALATTRS